MATRRKRKQPFTVQCMNCGDKFRAPKLECGTRCRKCVENALQMHNDLDQWIPKGWIPLGHRGPSIMEKRFGFLCIFAGLATPNDVSVAFDEVESGRNPLSPNLILVMVRRGLVSESEARAVLKFLAEFDRSPVDLEFGNLAKDGGQVTEQDLESWEKDDEEDSELPLVPWPVKAIENRRMQYPEIIGILDEQARRNRGLKFDLEAALDAPPASLIVPTWQKTLDQTKGWIASAERLSFVGRAKVWFKHIAVVTCILALGALAFWGYHYNPDLADTDTSVSLMICTACRSTVAWGKPDVEPQCPVCSTNDLRLLRRCASCLQVQQAESVFADATSDGTCEVCKADNWKVPYKFVKELSQR